MINEQILFGLLGVSLFGLGLYSLFTSQSLLRRVLAINIAGAGLFLQFIAVAYLGLLELADPVPHALVLTGIVVAFSATALALALGRRLQELSNNE